MSNAKYLKYRIAELRAALAPFAREADQWSKEVPDGFRPLCTEPGSATTLPGSETTFTIGDLRRARALLGESLTFEPQGIPHDGGPAFPVPEQRYLDGTVAKASPSISKRDWFATQALTALISCGTQGFPDGIARLAYEYADAMLAVREEVPDPNLRIYPRCPQCQRHTPETAPWHHTADGRYICDKCWQAESSKPCAECNKPTAPLERWRKLDGREICGDCWRLERGAQ